MKLHFLIASPEVCAFGLVSISLEYLSTC